MHPRPAKCRRWLAYRDTDRQFSHTTRTTRGQFLLTLDELADRYDEVYYKLRKAFESGAVLPPDHFSEDDLLKIREYMGFLEHAEVLIQQGSLDARVFDDLFGHRVRALAMNAQVMTATVHAHPERWRQFTRLMRRLKIVPASPVVPPKA